MRIILRSGVVIDTRVSEYTIKKNSITGEFTGLDWTMPEGSQEQLKYVRVEEIVAVVTVRNWRGR